MHKIDFTKKGGFPLDQETLDFMQNHTYENMNALVALCGCEASKKYILYGCHVSGSSITSGWVVIGNEILYFAGGTGTAIAVTTDTTSVEFENGQTHGVYQYKKAVISATGTPISQFIRLTNIKDLLSGVPNATISAKGVIEIATNDEVYTGTRADLAVTPKSLKDGKYVRDNNYTHTDNNFTDNEKDKLGDIANATETKAGLAERANATEATGGVDNVRFMTSYLTKALINTIVKPATEALQGLVERANATEADAGSDNTRYMTPYLVKRIVDKNKVTVPVASTTQKGISEFSDITEARAGTTGKVITADILKVMLSEIIVNSLKHTYGMVTVYNHRSSNSPTLDLENNWNYNYQYIYPPAGYNMSHLVSFTCSNAEINFTGDVNGDDVIYCKWKKESTRIKIIGGNTETDFPAKINYSAVWLK